MIGIGRGILFGDAKETRQAIIIVCLKDTKDKYKSIQRLFF